ncbi:MAG: hypothetical protein GY868_14470, partial [Deltaproteobacteria bacterium]|nr:hypothetical protein [Deltaproteobacteria bacterium]
MSCDLCSLACAADQTAAPEFMSLIVRMVSVLLLLLGLMLLALYGFKKFDLQRRNFLGMNKYMHIVDRLYLGPKKSL